jgi:hypothetical protein
MKAESKHRNIFTTIKIRNINHILNYDENFPKSTLGFQYHAGKKKSKCLI